MKNERREFARYVFTSKNLHLYIHGADLVKNIKDISIGGLAFHHTPILGEERQASLIDIFWDGSNPFYLWKIPCAIIYDQAALPEGQAFRGRDTRRCGLKFVSVSEGHRQRLALLFRSDGAMAI